MNRGGLSFWNQLQLAILHVLGLLLGAIDGLLKVDWGERLLERMARRWQSKLTRLDAALTQLRVERSQLETQQEALAIYAAVLYLGARCLARNELRFDPADPSDAQLLDASIDLLVKARLASIEPEQIGPGQYIYHLEPNWEAIRVRLADATEQAQPQVAEWFREGLDFIDESFLLQAAD